MHTQAPSDIGRTLASRQGMSCGKRNAPISGVAFVSREKPRNLAASVRQRLFSLAQERREDFGLVLTRYGLERFLYRLAQSQYRDQFILKGALLFELWTHRPYRSTRDLDLEGQGEDSITRIKRLFIEIMGQAVEDDGLIFDPQSLRVARIKEEQEYEGIRAILWLAWNVPESTCRLISGSAT